MFHNASRYCQQTTCASIMDVLLPAATLRKLFLRFSNRLFALFRLDACLVQLVPHPKAFTPNGNSRRGPESGPGPCPETHHPGGFGVHANQGRVRERRGASQAWCGRSSAVWPQARQVLSRRKIVMQQPLFSSTWLPPRPAAGPAHQKGRSRLCCRCGRCPRLSLCRGRSRIPGL